MGAHTTSIQALNLVKRTVVPKQQRSGQISTFNQSMQGPSGPPNRYKALFWAGPKEWQNVGEELCHLPAVVKQKQRQLAVSGRALQGTWTLWGQDNPKSGPQVSQVQKLDFNSSPRGDQTLGDWFPLTKLTRDWFINQNANLLIYNEKYNCQADRNTCVSWSAHSLPSRRA